MEVIKMADHIVDMGKESGNAGGYIIFFGTPEQLINYNDSYTAQYLKTELI
jgi:excinuclease ABC subunit A